MGKNTSGKYRQKNSCLLYNFYDIFSIFLEEGGVDVKNAQVLPNGNYNVRDIVLPQK